MTPYPRPLTSQEIDDGWCLEEAPPSVLAPPDDPDRAPDEEPYDAYILEAQRPSSAFEEAYWEQVEGRNLKHRFGDGAAAFGLRS